MENPKVQEIYYRIERILFKHMDVEIITDLIKEAHFTELEKVEIKKLPLFGKHDLLTGYLDESEESEDSFDYSIFSSQEI